MGGILLGNGLIHRRNPSNVVMGRIIEANLGYLNAKTIIDVGPRRSGRSTRLARWVVNTPGARACPVQGTISYMTTLLEEQWDASPGACNQTGTVPYNIGTPMPGGHFGYNAQGIKLAIDDYHMVSKVEQKNIMELLNRGAEIGYISVEGERNKEHVPHFDKLAFETLLLAKRLRNDVEFDKDKAIAMLEKAAQMLSPSNGVFPLLEEINAEWDTLEDED